MEEIVHQTLSVVPEIVSDIDQLENEIHSALVDSIAVREKYQQLLTMTQMQIASFQTINRDMQDQIQKTSDIDKAVNDLMSSTKKTTESVRSLYVEIDYLHHATINLLDTTKRFVKYTEARSQESE